MYKILSSDYEEFFSERLTQLRQQNGASAREMSLAIGQNGSYINRIENGKAFPSMQCFFYICEFLQVSPSDFFDMDARYPSQLRSMSEDLKKLDMDQLNAINAVIQTMKSRK
ncbi:MAG: helix-turn-helix domain-containing protein [Anaerovoracaceae bacterium]